MGAAFALSGMTGSITAAIAAASLALAAQDARPAPSTPAPRQSIAGLRGIECSSTVVYAARPADPHQLRATYVFPDRARLWIGVGEGQNVARQMRTRLGDEFHAVEPGHDDSRALTGDERDLAHGQMEMRRALCLWPDGFAWTKDGAGASAALGSNLGSLRASAAPGAKSPPDRIEWRDGDARLVDAFAAIRWSERDGRLWPATFELWHGEARVWSETIVSIDTRTRFIDSYFLPPDRRAAQATRAVEAFEVRPMDLPRHRARRIALGPQATWDDARAEWTKRHAAPDPALAQAGETLEALMTFEVDATLRPVAILERLAPRAGAEGQKLPPGFALTPERPGLMTFSLGLAALAPATLTRLKAAVPAEAQAGVPYVRFDPARAEGHVLLMLPLEARD